MNTFVVLATLIVAAAANPILLSNQRFIPIKSFRHDIAADGIYSIQSEGGDGTLFSEAGALVLPAGAKEHGATKSGQYSWTSPEGQAFTLSYVADENGFRPVASHLPVPPPMPEEIRAVLPTLPKLVEVEEHPTLIRSFAPLPSSHVSFGNAAPVIVSQPQRLLVAEAPIAPEKMFVQTPEFLIDSNMQKTLVRIGN